jgi:hypothetical protein
MPFYIANILGRSVNVVLNDFNASLEIDWSRNSAVGIATGYGMDDRGVGDRFPVRSRIFYSPCLPNRLWGPPNLLSNGYRGLLPCGVKRPGRETDHSSPNNAEVKKSEPVHPLPHTLSWHSA